jgi:hypothetical protein
VICMLTNDELELHPRPLHRAYQLQKQIAALQLEATAAVTELNQIILHCNENKVSDEDCYSLINKPETKHTIVPEMFAKEFPEVNQVLVSKLSGFLGCELDRLATTQILPQVNIKDVEKDVAKNQLYEKACTKKTYDHYSVVMKPQS